MPAISNKTILTAGYLLNGNRYDRRGFITVRATRTQFLTKKFKIFETTKSGLKKKLVLRRNQTVNSITFGGEVDVTIRTFFNGTDSSYAFNKFCFLENFISLYI